MSVIYEIASDMFGDKSNLNSVKLLHYFMKWLVVTKLSIASS